MSKGKTQILQYAMMVLKVLIGANAIGGNNIGVQEIIDRTVLKKTNTGLQMNS